MYMADYEIIEHPEHGTVRFYPGSGGLFKEKENGQLIIVGNQGGNPLMSDPEYAADLARRRADLRRQAIAEGLIAAGIDLGVVSKEQPFGILSEIVRQRARAAAGDGDIGQRDQTEAAKFIFSLTRQDESEEKKEENVIKFQLNEKQMSDVLDKLFRED